MRETQREGIGSGEFASRHIPDLMEEYAAEEITLYGVTGTPEDLIKMCPVPHEYMTLEAKNMFLAMAMNESASQVKPDHISYLKEVVESRGEALKITVRAEDKALTTTVVPTVDMPGTNTAKIKENHGKNKLSEPLHTFNTVTIQERFATDPSQTIERPVAEEYSGTSGENNPETPLKIKQNDLQMDVWLDQMQQEYKINLERTGQTLFEAENQDTESHLTILNVREETDEGESTALTFSRFEPGNAPEPINLDPTSAALTSVAVVELPRSPTNSSAFISNEVPDATISTLETISAELPAGEAIEDVASDSDESFYQKYFLNQQDLHIETAAVEEDQAEDYELTLNKLIPETTFEKTETTSLIEQIEEYLLSDNDLEVKTINHFSLLITEVNLILDEVHPQEKTSVEATEEIEQEIKDRLREVASDLIITLYGDYDEELIDHFIQTVLRQRITSIAETEDNKMTNIDEGAHVRKYFSIQDFIFSVNSSLPNFRLLGRYAIWQSTNVSGGVSP